MNEQKIRAILEAMKGITYLEWQKLSHTIEQRFKAEAGKQSNKIEIADPDIIVSDFKRLFWDYLNKNGVNTIVLVSIENMDIV